MTTTDHPQPPAPLEAHFTALIGALDSLRTAADEGTDGRTTSDLNQDLHATALSNLQAIATAAGLTWDDLLAERDRRAVVAE